MMSPASLFFSTLLILPVITGNVVPSVKDDNTNTTSPNLDDSMPNGWGSMCTKASKTQQNRTNITISCHVTVKDSWDFSDFRNWTAGRGDDILLTLDIVCDEEGSVCLPWPYRAAHLDTLKVKGCINVCYYADYSRQEVLEAIPDNLRVFEGYGVTAKSSIFDLMLLDMKNVPPVFDCGPLLIHTFIYRGGKSIITTPEGDLPVKENENITDAFLHNSNINDVDHICRYENMRVYDVSQRIDSSIMYLYNSIINSRFPQLRTLNLSHTDLIKFPAILSVWRRRFENLEMLDLSYNNISRFDLRDFSLTSQNVGIIDLRHNNIRTIGAKEIKSLGKLDKAIIDVRGNPFECNCAMANFTHYLQKHKNTEGAELHKNYSYLWDLTCVSPPRFRGRRIAELTKDLLCSSDVSSYVAQISVLSIVVVLLTIVIILMARYRKEVRILIFTRLHIVLPCQPAETSFDKTYDAFVAYSHLDTTWVVKTLLPRLENGTGGVGGNFRLCLHQRDFEVGAAIADNIVQSVEESRHTILVLSKNFLKSEWCLMEFRTAFHQSLIERKKHLIIVLLEDIPLHDLDPDLRRCMKTWTYIHISDRLFWDRIVYSLTDKRKSRWKRFHRQKIQDGQKEDTVTTTKDVIKTGNSNEICLQIREKDTFPYEFSD